MVGSILLGALGLLTAAASMAFWIFVATRAQERFRRRVERRYNVVIATGYKGQWRVSGSGSWLRRLAIEGLQLGYILAAFVVWATAMLLIVGFFSLAQR
jgi:hypothetical protein